MAQSKKQAASKSTKTPKKSESKASKSSQNVSFANSDKFFSARVWMAGREDKYPLPRLDEIQIDSFDWFLGDGIRELFEEVFPVEDFQGNKLELDFISHEIGTPKYTQKEALEKELTYEAPMNARFKLANKETGEIKEQEVFMGNTPMMTERGTFITNGVERVIINQLVRSPGAFYSRSTWDSDAYNLKLIPNRGAWIEVESEKGNVLVIKIDRKRKMYVTTFLRALGYETDKEIIDLFKDIQVAPDKDFILSTLEKDTTSTTDEALQHVYRRIRPGDLATADNARQLISQMFFDYGHYDIGKVGRYKINQRLGLNKEEKRENYVFMVDDFVEMIRELVRMNASEGQAPEDDIDALYNRRLRSVGELVQNKFRVGLLRSERIIRDRMSTLELEGLTPQQLINAHPIVAALREFFTSSQLSQFMDQGNPLAELAHKRRLSALGPGGLTRERASFEVRDVHPSHYGRICPIETPEGPNIGLVVQLASYARVNRYGFIEAPFRTIKKTAPNKKESLVGRDLMHGFEYNGKHLYEDGTIIDEKIADEITKYKDVKEVLVRPYISDEVEYYDAYAEREMTIVPFSIPTNEMREFTTRRVTARVKNEPTMEHIDNVTHVDVSSMQLFSTDTALIPFLEHNDNVRAAVGSNQQRQAVSLIRPEAPYVGTGLEYVTAKDSGQVVVSETPGAVTYVDSEQIVVMSDDGKRYTYDLRGFEGTNQGTITLQRPIVKEGDYVMQDQVISDGPAVDGDELAIGQNLLVGYMAFHGYNYEDAIIISDNVARKGLFDSVHIEDHQIDLRDTKLGPEQFTSDIPNVSADRLKNLDEDGYVATGSEVSVGDILIGKITPKGETELTPEEKLLRAIFGDKAADVKDSSLRIQSGETGKVIGIRELTRETGAELPTGVMKRVIVSVAKIKRISVGDKMAGRHGNKGVISKIMPLEDMPFMKDGTPLDIALNPLGVISRMNLGQLLETHLGTVAHAKNIKIATPVLNGVSEDKIQELYREIGFPEHGKVQLYDGGTGEPYALTTLVGYKYMLKLSHIVEDKIHARSVGTYSLVTQQPLGGKAQKGGQRFGEMEVWALEAYGASYALQEMLTIKSDDVLGRGRAYEKIVKGESPENPSIPASFHVLIKELQACGLDPQFLDKEGEVIDLMAVGESVEDKEAVKLTESERQGISEEYKKETDSTAQIYD